MSIRVFLTILAMTAVLSAAAAAEDAAKISKQYKALKHAPPSASSTWAILDRDGANRRVAKYLSSLGAGESGTGVMASPSFQIASDKITLTVCGHDGQQGGRKKNYVALVDARKGTVLQQTMAPGGDSMQPELWDVARLRGREVRIEVHDGDSGGAYAWLGVGQIDAGPALRIDFRNGLPDGWTASSEPIQQRTEVVEGGVPFRRYYAQYTMVPASGAAEIPCGFVAERLFVLGCVVPVGKPLETYGQIEIVYRQGPPDRFPLMCGYTLDVAGKLPSTSKAMYLHGSGDVFQHYLVLGPRPEVIDKIILRRNPDQEFLPRITTITCQTQAASDTLEPLPEGAPSTDEEAWIRSHTITSSSPDMGPIQAEIRRAHKLP
jgi:hypothetical protein